MSRLAIQTLPSPPALPGEPIYPRVGRLNRSRQPAGPAEQPNYRQRQDYRDADRVPVVIVGKEVGRMAVSELFPSVHAFHRRLLYHSAGRRALGENWPCAARSKTI